MELQEKKSTDMHYTFRWQKTIKIPTKQKYLDGTRHFYSDSIPWAFTVL